MSRSRKKYPVHDIGSAGRGNKKKWKKECHHKFRRIPNEEDLPNGSKYKIMSGNIWCSPTDGKIWWANGWIEKSKLFRK